MFFSVSVVVREPTYTQILTYTNSECHVDILSDDASQL